MKIAFQALRMLFVLSLLTGLGYPFVVTGIAKVIFPNQAGGSLIVRHQQVLGSSLISQSFKEPKYFWPRPSAVDFNPLPSGGSNFGPTSKDLLEKIKERQSAGLTGELLFASASGLDPHISPNAAHDQIERIVAARKLGQDETKSLTNIVEKHIEKPLLGFLGEPRINVLEINLVLDEEFPI